MTASEIKGVVALVACEVCGGSVEIRSMTMHLNMMRCVACDGRGYIKKDITLAELAAALKQETE